MHRDFGRVIAKVANLLQGGAEARCRRGGEADKGSKEHDGMASAQFGRRIKYADPT